MKRLERGVGDQEVVIETLEKGELKPLWEPHRFFILMLGAFGCCCASFNYAFALISEPLQKRYDLSYRDVGTILTVGLVVKYFLTPYAYLYDRIGIRPVCAIMTTYFVIGTACLAQCFSGGIEGSVLRLSVFNAFFTCGGSMFDMVCCMTILSHFPSYRGAAAAYIKAFTGLGSSLASSLYAAFFNKRTDLYFYFLMSVAATVGLLFFLFVQQPPYYIMPGKESQLTPEEIVERKRWKTTYLKQKAPLARFVYGFVLVFFLIAYLPITVVLTAYLDLSQKYKTAFAIISATTWLMVPLIAVPFPGLNGPKASPDKSKEVDSNVFSERSKDYVVKDVSSGALTQLGTTSNHNTDVSLEEEEPAPPETDMDYVAPQYQSTFLRNLLTLELWALWWTMFCCLGAQFVVIFNSHHIYSAFLGRKCTDPERAMLAALNGVSGAVGRLLMAYFEIWTQKRKAEGRIPITVSLYVPVLPTILTFILLLALPTRALPLSFVVVALGSGFTVAICMLLTRTIYAKDSALHYNFCFTAPGVASVVLIRFLFSEWYAVQAERRGSSKVCLHRKCVEMPMIVLIVLSCSALLSSFIVDFRYRRFCGHALKERERIRMAALEEANKRRVNEECGEASALEHRSEDAVR